MADDDTSGTPTTGDGDDAGTPSDAGAAEATRCWLVEREYTDKGLVTLVYATPDGERAATMQRSSNMLASMDVTAARDVDPDILEPVTDTETRERYAHEVERTRDSHAPDDPI
jgi:hypothetical protein